ncbi:MAG: hypothetical protein FGM24_05435 [Candidatus Kapabacteria bacterium]|nr:hypothetical protein [Candidatus Kapabacteria bacterium]
MVLSDVDEVVVALSIRRTIEDYNLKALAFNICEDHVHLALVSDEEDVPRHVRLLKGRSSRDLRLSNPELCGAFPRCWARGYFSKTMHSPEQVRILLRYIRTNRQRHRLETNSELEQLVW